LAKALGVQRLLGFNESSFNHSRSFLMNPSLSSKALKRQQRNAEKSFIERHFNTFSVAIVTVAALHMNSAIAQMSAPAKPAPEMSAKVQEAFARADKNADNKLSKEEAAAMPAIAEAFDKADVDKDGFLSKAEFAEVAKE
jgi:Ca2+-binding EF-hand superfamily protein